MPLFNREDKKQRIDLKQEHLPTEQPQPEQEPKVQPSIHESKERQSAQKAKERLSAQEAKERELQARQNQKNIRHRAKIAEADARAEAAEHRLENEKRNRKLREAQQKEREEKKKAKADYRSEHPGFYNPNLRVHSVFVVALTLLSVFISISFLLQEQVGSIGAAIAHGLLGCFSYTACLIPVFMLIHAALWRSDVRSRLLVTKAVTFIPVLLLTAALAAILSPDFDTQSFSWSAAYADGRVFEGGGAIGGAIGYLMHRMIGIAGTVLLAIVVYLFFIALYGRTYIHALYKKACARIKAARVEKAKRREALRAEKRAEKDELAAVRREEKHKQKLARLRGEETRARKAPRQKAPQLKEAEPQETPSLPPITEGQSTPAARPHEKTVPAVFNARERVTFTTPAAPEKKSPQKPASIPTPKPQADRFAAEEAERQENRREAIERRRSLFLDFEQEEKMDMHTPAITDNTDFADIRRDMKNAPVLRAVTYDGGEDDFTDIRRETKGGAAPARATAPTPAPSTEAKQAPADPMSVPANAGFTTDLLKISKEKVQPVRVVATGPIPVTEAVSEPEAKEKSTAGNSPLGKLFRRAAEKAAAEKAEQEKPTAAEPETPDNDLDYFRSITVNAGEKDQLGSDRPFLHPDITPLPPRDTAPARPRPAAQSFLSDGVAGDAPNAEAEDSNDIIVEEEMIISPAAKTAEASANPFHPRNNPAFRSPGEEKEKPRYDGLQGAQVFTPTSTLRDDLAAARREAPTTPVPAPAPASATGRGRIVQEKIDISARPAPKQYQFPPLSLLTLPEAVDEGNISAEVQSNAETLVTTLESFKVRSRVTGYSRGPRITRYEVVPDAGIRVRAISNLVDDISMALASPGVRIEAPIPGKSAVGIEVPNSSPTLVRLRGMLDSEKFRSFPDKTVVCLGGDVTGQPVYCDLAKMPHLLVAGATGMGKSVCINSIITSILYKASPDDVKLIMIDPKKVEFGIYSGIPHLLVPVVTDPKKAAGALSWAVNEMERRYGLMEQTGVRDMKGYNRYVEETGDGEHLARIVIIIDELADLMASAADAVETSIARIAAKARAAGIHLLIGTQRPSVDVITGTIKNNIPSRIAFHVSSQVDSRTILDFAGAEKLLAHGDMLYAPAGMSKPVRVQGAFVDDKEIDRVVSFLKSNNEVDGTAGEEIMADIEREAEKCVPQKKNGGDEGGGANIPTDDDDNHLLWAALEIGFEYGKLATSLLQRKLSVGYGKAAKILDALQEMGCVSPPDGSKPREILISREEFKEMMARGVREQCGDNFT